MLPALVDTGGYGYNVNDVSGYFHVHRTARSEEFFGFEWQGVYCCTQLLTLDGSKSLVGKLGALALAAPGILMKLRRCYKALVVASRSPSTVLRVTGPLRDELRELASMHFWRAAVAPWMRPVHLTIVVSKNVTQGTTVRGRYAPGEALV
jgi:hypothetical protein